ncbi:quinoprotein relay system zinc metallohydrolase 1 [Salmonella enterica subsp. enterica]|nr:quinoprotein relay system zinc metallohydrolase 1 [Salmonella enterica subsp. enterica serovar Enteritidis]
MLSLAAAGCVCAFCGPGAAQALSYKLDAREIGSKVWGVFGATDYFSFANGGNISNTAFIETPDGVVVVDSGPSRRYGEALLELIASKAPGKKVLRVYNTHHHPDHFLGNQVFDPSIVASSPGVIQNIKDQGNAMADNMYRLVGDWMRGTNVTVPGVSLTAPVEDVGGRKFGLLYLSGHTSADLVVHDMESGVLFAGDLAFLDRAPTTPSADLPHWRDSIAQLRKTDRSMILPGHGPDDRGQASLDQTLDWLDWLDGTIADCVRKGLTMNEAMAVKVPARFAALGVAKGEYERSVVHLYQRYEDAELAEVPVER